MKIGNFDLNREILIVAEIGNNHEGNFDVANELVRMAAQCGVGAVKFQVFRAEDYVSRSDSARFRQLKSFELSYSEFEQLSDLARSLGLLVISTPFDLASAEFLETIVDSYKIASGDNNFYPLLDRIASTGRPVIISTGISDLRQVSQTVAYMKQRWIEKNIPEQLVLLHCVSGYPTPPDQANLQSIRFLADNFDCTIGYSDHTIGLEAALIAVVLGARIIEKHFTIDKTFSDFRDHQLSADPVEMRELVERVQLASSMLGEYHKRVQPCEEAMVTSIRRSIAANADLPSGHRIDWSDLTWVRPSGGLAPGEEHRLIGKVLKRSVRIGYQLHESDVE